MRNLSIFAAMMAAIVLMGIGLKIMPQPNSVYAAMMTDEVIAEMNAEARHVAPKFPRKPLLPADVKVILNDSNGHGSAVHIGGGWFLTAGHVADLKAKRFDIQLADKSIRKAEILWSNMVYDIGLFRADGDGMERSELKCAVPAIGDEITIVGNPLMMDGITAFGRIAGAESNIGPWKKVLVISGPMMPGQSGGAIYNSAHELVGISVGLATWPQGFIASPTGYGMIVSGRVVCYLLARV